MSIFRWGIKHITSFDTIPEAQPSRCVRTMSPLAKCQICMDVCPKKGVQLSQDGPVIVDCSSCGQCVRACPERALTYDDKDILMNLKQSRQLVIGCRRDEPHPAVDVQVPCMQMLRPADLLLWAHFLDDLWLYVPRDLCTTCENDWFPEALQLPIEQSLLMEATRIHIVSEEEMLSRFLSTESMNRRTFFKSSADKIIQTTLKIGEKEVEKQWLHCWQKENKAIADRSLLLGLYQSQKDNIDKEATIRFATLSLTHCVFCSACVMVCPHEALCLSTIGNRLVLSYATGLCSGCHLCQDVCPVNGMQPGGHIKVADLIDPKWTVLASSDGQYCTSCGDLYYEYPASGSRCRFCEKK